MTGFEHLRVYLNICGVLDFPGTNFQNINPGLARVSKMKLKYFPDFLQNPGPGRLPLNSGCGDVEFACVFASEASPNSYFENF